MNIFLYQNADQAGLDGLAEAHVVRDQERDAGHLDGPDDRVELVVLHLNPRPERCLNGADNVI
jgi:hypothetical protein